MVKVMNCPVCEKGKLPIDISNGYKVVFQGKFNELPCRIFCKNCKRLIKYKVVKNEED